MVRESSRRVHYYNALPLTLFGGSGQSLGKSRVFHQIGIHVSKENLSNNISYGTAKEINVMFMREVDTAPDLREISGDRLATGAPKREGDDDKQIPKLI